MRRMNYDRFAKPYNFGEYDSNFSRFSLDKNIEEGVYLIRIEDASNGNQCSGIIDLRGKLIHKVSSIMNDYTNDEQFYLAYQSSNAKNFLQAYSTSGDDKTLEDGTIIYLYKLD